MEVLVGAGGWAYFNIPGQDRLTAYARAFPFVEVNSTFYEHPDPKTVDGWRRRVPRSFSFAVRAHREVTHRNGLRATPAARASFAQTVRLADRIDAIAVVLETPETIHPWAEDLRDLLGSVTVPCPVALEARAYRGRALPPPLAATMTDHDVADVADFSRQPPRTKSSLAYGRMFGLGTGNRWEFTADELARVRRNGERAGSNRALYAFHGVRMYSDAGRFLTFVRTGAVPRPARDIGLRSLEDVLEDGAPFPATPSELIREHGFRVVVLPGGREVHVAELLARLPPGPYDSPRRIRETLQADPGVFARETSPR